ncbi:chemotaxis protein CheA [Natrinema hispanicum]|uniref:Chemotaxis protein CheA n=1 Tax=Natrinema hispanicum TaxID=392421 RepID=A0A1G6U721_9EURY|nr:chemotaxis protein CheA [Natrinema hispanicum]SDD37083.1 two-component system, chemotaxis family, sensor kinase CheA [Natrinema hispanicum]SEU02362.1 two-component system, chemotaxis family, sensor kinase CheA [Natrinema hispanicum]
MTEYLTEFVQESEERITELNNALLTLERDPDDEAAMENIFRIAHTLKGNCGAMGLEPASDLAHAIEDILDAVRGDDLEVSPGLMDDVFDAVDELETMVDEVATTGEIETDPSATIAALRSRLDGTDREATTGRPVPSDDEIDAVCSRFDPPADDTHDVYFARLAITERENVNNGKLVVDALIDAFDLIGTDPPQPQIEADEYDGEFDAVFATPVGEAAIASGLEPVDEVDDFEIVDVTDRFEISDGSAPSAPDADPGDDISSEEAQELEVDELLDEFDEFDNLDEQVESIDDDELEPFDDMGEAGSFDDLLGEDEIGDLDDEPVDAPAEPAPDATTTAGSTGATDDDAAAVDADPDEVDDASAVFDELKDEVEMVGFDELQDELDELEFDEFDDEEEVGMDELLGENAADDSFLDEDASESEVDDVLVDAPAGDDGEFDDVDVDAIVETGETSADDLEPADETVEDADTDDRATADDLETADADEADGDTDEADVDTDDSGFEPADKFETGDDGDAVADDSFGADVTHTDETFGESAVADAVDSTDADDAFGDETAESDPFETATASFDDDEFDDSGFADPTTDSFEGADDDFEDVLDDDVFDGTEAFDSADVGFDATTDSEAGDDSSAPSTASFGDDAADSAGDAADDGVVRIVDEPELVIPDIDVPERDEQPDDDETDEVQSVRVDIEQIDSLLTLVEGLVTSRVRLRHAAEVDEDEAAIQTELDALSDLTSDLQETVMDIRLVPLETVTNRLPRVVRDIARDQDKQVAFEMSGEDVELDRSILDRIGDPLIHLVRNAVDHGIESPDVREAAGKPLEGTVEVTAERERDRVTITVTDDGSGLDPDRLRAEAVDADVLTDDEAAAMADDDAYDLIFHSGLSTADEVTDVSGRGVGMDVVKRTVEDLEGTVSIDSDEGAGTTVTMTLPVTVAIDEILFVESGGEEFGVPTKAVRDVESARAIETVDGEAVLPGEVGDYPVVSLADVLETPAAGEDGDGMVVRIREEVREVALHCDEIRGQQEVVVKPFEGFMSGVPGISGATVRGRGEVVNILDVTTL